MYVRMVFRVKRKSREWYRYHKIGGIFVPGVLSGWGSGLRERPEVDLYFVCWLRSQGMVRVRIGS